MLGGAMATVPKSMFLRPWCCLSHPLTLHFDTGTLYALRCLLYLSHFYYHEICDGIAMSLVQLTYCVWYTQQSPLESSYSRHFSILGTDGLATAQRLAERASLPIAP